MKATYKNTPISYTSQGTGNPLVLLHGFLESKEIWKDFTEELSAKATGYLYRPPRARRIWKFRRNSHYG